MWRVEPSSYYVKQDDGNQVRMHVDETTQMIGNIGQGEQIEAKVDEQNHAVSIRSAQAVRDRRNAKQQRPLAAALPCVFLLRSSTAHIVSDFYFIEVQWACV